MCVRHRWWTQRHSACVVYTSWTSTSTRLCFGIIICSARNMFLHPSLHGCMTTMCREWGRERSSSSPARSKFINFSCVFIILLQTATRTLISVVCHQCGFENVQNCRYIQGWTEFQISRCCCVKQFQISEIGSLVIFVCVYMYVTFFVVQCIYAHYLLWFPTIDRVGCRLAFSHAECFIASYHAAVCCSVILLTFLEIEICKAVLDCFCHVKFLLTVFSSADCVHF